MLQKMPPSLNPNSGGAASAAGGLQSSNRGDGGDEVHARPPQCRLYAVATLCRGAEMFRLLQHKAAEVRPYRHLQKIPAGTECIKP